MIVAVAESPPAVNWAACPLLFVMMALREKVSSFSTMVSLIIVMSQGVDMSPGPLPAVNVTVHVVATKSAPAMVERLLVCYNLTVNKQGAAHEQYSQYYLNDLTKPTVIHFSIQRDYRNETCLDGGDSTMTTRLVNRLQMVEPLNCIARLWRPMRLDFLTCSSVSCLSTSCNLFNNCLCCCPTGCVQHKTDREWSYAWTLWICWLWEPHNCNCRKQTVKSSNKPIA